MGWILFAIATWTTALLLVPLRWWKRLWIMGIVAMIAIYLIDSTLAKLGAFRFIYEGSIISGLPLPYWIGYFPGGVTFEYFRPTGNRWSRIGYIFLAALFLLALEAIMLYTGYFKYIRWNIASAMVLNLGGFTIAMWVAEWLDLKSMPIQNM